MVQRFRFIGITVLSILVLTIIGTSLVSPAYAFVAQNLSVSTSTPVLGQTFQFTVTDDPSVFPVNFVIAPNGPGCNNPQVPPYNPLVITSGPTFTVTVTAGPPFVVGTTYCAVFIDSSFSASNIVTFTIQPTTPIPEYPVGLAVLAVFMIIGYGVIRRKTRDDYI